VIAASGRDAESGLVEVTDLTVSYGDAPVLRGATVRFEPGTVTGIIGPNGAGKSSLLKAIVGLVPVEAGRVRIGGRPVALARRRVAYLPQRAVIDWDYPAQVAEVVAMGAYPRRGRAARSIATAALERVQLADVAGRQIGELSGGQQQRVLFARALAQQARILLLDEPFVGVDALTEQLLRCQIRRLAEEGATVVVVNHDLATVAELFDRVAVLAGRIIACGPTAEVFTGDVLARAYRGQVVGPVATGVR
jgi:manganese/zinc/iron transport system ATP- binding protein